MPVDVTVLAPTEQRLQNKLIKISTEGTELQSAKQSVKITNRWEKTFCSVNWRTVLFRRKCCIIKSKIGNSKKFETPFDGLVDCSVSLLCESDDYLLRHTYPIYASEEKTPTTEIKDQTDHQD